MASLPFSQATELLEQKEELRALAQHCRVVLKEIAEHCTSLDEAKGLARLALSTEAWRDAERWCYLGRPDA